MFAPDEVSLIFTNPSFASVIPNQSVINATFAVRLLSRAVRVYPENETKDMVPKIARIVITTISSTRVNALDFFAIMKY